MKGLWSVQGRNRGTAQALDGGPARQPDHMRQGLIMLVPEALGPQIGPGRLNE
jgi:hypothetical protein